jgi:uncharacterized protein involved in outer membrane biogenesis
MHKARKWWIAVPLALLALLAAVALALHAWLASDDLRGRIEREASAALGVPVHIGALAIDLWPLPAVAATDVQVRTVPVLRLQRLEARPAWPALLRGRLDIATLLVREAVLPEQAVWAIAAAIDRQSAGKPAAGKPGPGTAEAAPVLPRRTVLDQVTWVDVQGRATTIDAQLRLDDDGLPGAAQLKVHKGRLQGAALQVTRASDHWLLRADIGGGTVKGPLSVAAQPGGGWRLQGQLATAGVEIAALTAPSRTLTGKLEAQTTLRAQFSAPGQLADALRTETRFTVRGAVVQGIDLAQAVRTVGLSRGGMTRLDALAGNVATQGRAVQLTQLVASSGLLAATGQVAIAPDKRLSGRINVDLSGAAGGALGVPLVVGGTVDAPSVTLSRGALLGAAIGTAVAPGVGTGAGAKLGDRLGQGLKGLFGK